MPVTFDVDKNVSAPEKGILGASNVAESLETELEQNKGKIIRVSTPDAKNFGAPFRNGLIGSLVTAYNSHLHLVLSPDDVWIGITTSLSRYIDANAEKLRPLFVSHEGKIELEAYGGGDIYSANYDDLISQLSDKISDLTKGDIRDWIECNFSTTTSLTKIVSKIVLMGAMKNYFEYKMYLLCGLPKVTLLGSEEDWKTIRARVDKMTEWKDKTLTNWAGVLGFVLDNFVNAFSNKVDKDFWNRVAHYTGGGSGPTYLEGWSLAFIGFDKKGNYFLDDLSAIKKTKKFGRMETGDIPPCMVEVPVKINDNGIQYDTLFYAGSMLASYDGLSISPVHDWALVDITKR